MKNEKMINNIMPEIIKTTKMKHMIKNDECNENQNDKKKWKNDLAQSVAASFS